MERVRSSSSSNLAGICTVVSSLEGVLGDQKEENVPREIVADFCGVEEGVELMLYVESTLRSVCLFCNLLVGRSALASGFMSAIEVESVSIVGMPRGTGAELPLNQPANPPRLLSSSFMTPGLSPVSVGMKPSSSSLSPSLRNFSGLRLRFRSGDFDFAVRKDGRREVRLRVFAPVFLATLSSSQTGSLFFRSGDAIGAGGHGRESGNGRVSNYSGEVVPVEVEHCPGNALGKANR